MTFLDMDGVLVDFVGGLRRLFPALPAERDWPTGEYDLPRILGVSGNQMWRRIDAAGLEWWEGLEPYPWMEELLTLAAPFTILSAPSLDGTSAAGKVRWIRKHLGSDFRDYVLCPRPHKRLLAGPGRRLIDDHDGSVAEFRAAGGEALLWPRPWNARHAEARDPLSAVAWALAEKAS